MVEIIKKEKRKMNIKIKMIRPVFTGILTTADRYENDNTVGGVILDINKSAGAAKEYQTVVAVGSSVREVKVGDIIVINPTRYMKKDPMDDNSLREEFVTPKYHLEMPEINLDGKPYFLLEDRDIGYVVTDYEEIKDSLLIAPKKPRIITN